MPRRAPSPPVVEPPAAPAGAREALLRAATAAFAAKGYAAASTREICESAGVNIAAIAYYFGGKEGLYRETLRRPVAEVIAALGRFDDPALDFEQSMRMFLAAIIDAGGSHDTECAALENDVLKLHLREMLEPSPAFREIVDQLIAPAHRALVRTLARHCGLARADDELHQLAFAIAAIAHDYCKSRAFMTLLAPGILERPQAKALILDRLVGYARALLEHEIARRRAAGAAEPTPARGAARRAPRPRNAHAQAPASARRARA